MATLSNKRMKRLHKTVRFDDAELETIHFLPISCDAVDEQLDDAEEIQGMQSATSEQQQRTSEVTFLSSAHGKARRELRDVAIFDLQSAVKHGVKTRGRNCRKTGMPRWKYVYGNVVYITDSTSTREVTCYKQAVDIVPADISLEMMDRHLKDAQMLIDDSNICATHTIVVVDQSGSMRASDVAGFKNRSQAAYGVLALEYVAEQLHQRESGSGVLDAISLIEMNDFGNIVDERCPMDWVYFNKLLKRQKEALPRSHGNYNNALVSIMALIDMELSELDEPDMDDLPVYSIIFLSDGKPSDKDNYASQLRSKLLMEIAQKLKSNLLFHCIGLGASASDFQALRAMSSTITIFGGQGTFSFSELSTAQLSAAFTSASTSMTATRTEKMSIGEEAPKREKKDVHLRSKSIPRGKRNFIRQMNKISRWGFDHEKDRQRNSSPWHRTSFKNRGAVGFDIEADPFGKGAERLAYMFYEIDMNRRRLGKEMVAKESIHINDEDRKMKFHEAFCRVQSKSNELAVQFNKAVARSPGLISEDASIKTPTISFLDCHVYEYVSDVGGEEFHCGLLVEDYLLGKFTKYNSNNGYFKNPKGGSTIELPVGEVYLTDFLQAFSHWVYFTTDQKLLICDLQGVQDSEGSRPRFLLTDPCICSKGQKGVRRYGRSDMKMKGIRIFRKGHKCNGVCKGLGLPPF